MSLSKIEHRACEILLAAARRRAPVTDFRADLQRERIYSRTWLPLFRALGLICLPISAGSEKRFVTFMADNVVAFAPRAGSKPLADGYQRERGAA